MGTTAPEAVPSLTARKMSSKRGQGSTSAAGPQSWRAARWLNAPRSPSKERTGPPGPPIPGAGRGIGQAEEVEDAVDAAIDQVVDGLRVVIEARDRRGDDGAHFRQCRHVSEVAKVKGAFANHQDQFAPLFQGDVGGTDHQVGTDAAGD